MSCLPLHLLFHSLQLATHYKVKVILVQESEIFQTLHETPVTNDKKKKNMAEEKLHISFKDIVQMRYQVTGPNILWEACCWPTPNAREVPGSFGGKIFKKTAPYETYVID